VISNGIPPIQLTAPNGICSHGVGNVGTYNSNFFSADVTEQVFNNPAGRYDYKQLIDQAKGQTYIITDLFNNSNIPESMFSTFLPNDTMPTTAFLSDPAPTDPNPTNPSPSNPANPTSPNPAGGGGGATSLVLSCPLVIVLACSMLAMLL